MARTEPKSKRQTAPDPRGASCERTTKETQVQVVVQFGVTGADIGSATAAAPVGAGDFDTQVPFFDHMLLAMAFHGGFALQVHARGDVEVDPHHVVEDVGLVLGECLREVREAAPIARFGSALVPMDDALAEVAIDAGGRPYLHYAADLPQARAGDFDVALVREFLAGLAIRAQLNLHVTVRHGVNSHHMVEATFKALGRALAAAYQPARGQMSTKGTL